MQGKGMRRHDKISVAIIACAMLLLCNTMIAAQEEDQPKPPSSFEQQYLSPDEHEPIKGYPVRKRRIGGPMDVEWDLDDSFPKRGSLLELILRCREGLQQ